MNSFRTLAVVIAIAAPSAAHAQFASSAPINGISCDAMEGQRTHIHQHVLIFDHGKAVNVPPDVGQSVQNRCLYWVHTHTPDGIIHIESPNDRVFTLGDFFAVWRQPLSKTVAATAKLAKGEQMKVWVDGKPFTGNPAFIPLKSHTDIVIQVGGPFIVPPKYTAWGTL